MEKLDNLLDIGEDLVDDGSIDQPDEKKEKKVVSLMSKNLGTFKDKLKKFGGNLTSLMASMTPKVEDEEEKPTPLGAWIAECDQLGKLKMQFNQSLVPELFYKEDITPSLIEFTIESTEDGVDAKNLKFDWEATKVDYELGQIDFQLDFSNPVWISAGDSEDIIKLNILDIQFFKPLGPLA